jgi:hypothetical protein
MPLFFFFCVSAFETFCIEIELCPFSSSIYGARDISDEDKIPQVPVSILDNFNSSVGIQVSTVVLNHLGRCCHLMHIPLPFELQTS